MDTRVLWLTRESFPPTTFQSKDLSHIDWIVSYNYPYVLPPDIVRQFEGRAVNLHISYLPWNRGADPNLWSWVDDTPKGVSIHLIDEGLDTGPILVQERVALAPYLNTLRTSYDHLHMRIRELFVMTWPSILDGRITAKPQKGEGSYHRRIEKQKINLPWGWDTPCALLPLTGPNVDVE